MKIFHLCLALAAVSLYAPLFADQAADDAAEKRRQEQQIQDRKIEDQQIEQRRLDQQRINRQIEQRRQDDRRRLNGYELAARDRDKRNDLMDRDDYDLMDETLDERSLERNFQNNQNHSNHSEPQAGCPSCQPPAMTCQDRETLNQIEAEDKCEEYQHEQRVERIEQWDWDHSRD